MTTPLVLLHGFTGAPDAWDGLLAHAAPRRVVAPRLFGHLAPGATEPERSFEAEVDRLAALVAAEELQGAHLVGYSLGARLALWLLVRRPELFSRATLVGVNPGLDAAACGERVAADERWAGLLETGGVGPFAEAWAAQPLFATQAELPPHALAAEHARRRSHTAVGLARSLRRLGLGAMPDAREALPGLARPVTYVAGALDPKFTALAREAGRRTPGARVAIVDSAGHNVVLERPRELAALLSEGSP